MRVELSAGTTTKFTATVPLVDVTIGGNVSKVNDNGLVLTQKQLRTCSNEDGGLTVRYKLLFD